MEIVSAKDLNANKETYLIYAAPGVGKTTSLKFIPGKTLVIDIDKSSLPLRGSENIDIVRVDVHNIWESWTNIVKELLKGAADKYDTVVIDNVSELFRATLAQLGREGKNNRVPTMADYQRVDFTILDSLRALQKLDARIVFTAWEKTDEWKEENGQTFSRAMPDIRPSIINNFMGLCSVVGRLTRAVDEEGKERRGFILQPTRTVYAKNRLDERSGCKVEELVLADD